MEMVGGNRIPDSGGSVWDGWTRGFLDPAFPAASRRCFQVEAHGVCVAGVVSKQEKQLFLGGLTSGDPAVMPRVLRFANRLMWQWGCRSGQLESAANALTLEEEKTVWKQKKSGRCREGACRIEWELEEGNIKVGVLRCQIDPLVQRNRLEAQVMTAKLLDVERRGEVIAQIHHWGPAGQEARPPDRCWRSAVCQPEGSGLDQYADSLAAGRGS